MPLLPLSDEQELLLIASRRRKTTKMGQKHYNQRPHYKIGSHFDESHIKFVHHGKIPVIIQPLLTQEEM